MQALDPILQSNSATNNEGEINIFQAAVDHDFDSIVDFINNDGDVNITDESDQSLLLLSLSTDISCDNNSERLPHYLLDQNIDLDGIADIEDRLKDGCALHLAFLNNYTSVFVRLTRIPNIDINATADDDTSSDGCFAVTIPVGKGVTLNSTYIKRRFTEKYFLEKATVLHYACLSGNEPAVSAICGHSKTNLVPKANLVLNKNLIDDFGFVDMSERENPEVDDDPENNEGEEFLGWGYAARDTWRVNRVKGVTPLHLAARSGHLVIVKLLHSKGAPLDSRDGEGYSILDYAKIGLEEFEDAYQIALGGELCAEPASKDAPTSVVAELRIEREKDIDRDIGSIITDYGNPEAKINQYKDLIRYLETQLTNSKDVSTLESSLQALNVSHVDPIAEQELARMLQVEKRFFDISRNRNPETQQLKGAFLANRYGTSNVARDITDIPMRRLITADAASVQESIAQSGGTQNLRTREDILRNLKVA